MKKRTIDRGVLLLKPVSSRCNLDCDYCFYRDEARNRRVPCGPLMEERTVRSILSKFLPGTKDLSICFQGGEPLLAGLPWFERFDSIAKELQKETGSRIHYSIQTNGVLIDESWCGFFKKNRFLVGVSFDGLPLLHRLHRGRTSRQTLDAIRLMQRRGVDFNVLLVVTNDMVDSAPSVWDFLMENDLTELQFIPCLDPIGGPADKFLDPRSYGRFLCFLADRWHASWYDDDCEDYCVHIRLFENFLAILNRRAPDECGVLGFCSDSYVFESDGSVYPCDFYCLDTHLLGNINHDSIEEIDERREELDFVQSSITTNEECLTCPFSPFCMGGCRRQRDGSGRFRFCESYKMLFSQKADLFLEAAEDLESEVD